MITESEAKRTHDRFEELLADKKKAEIAIGKIIDDFMNKYQGIELLDICSDQNFKYDASKEYPISTKLITKITIICKI
jgi:hypothetical protein